MQLLHSLTSYPYAYIAYFALYLICNYCVNLFSYFVQVLYAHVIQSSLPFSSVQLQRFTFIFEVTFVSKWTWSLPVLIFYLVLSQTMQMINSWHYGFKKLTHKWNLEFPWHYGDFAEKRISCSVTLSCDTTESILKDAALCFRRNNAFREAFWEKCRSASNVMFCSNIWIASNS